MRVFLTILLAAVAMAQKPANCNTCCLGDTGCDGLPAAGVDGTCCPRSAVCCATDSSNAAGTFLCCEGGAVCTANPFTSKKECMKPLKERTDECPNACMSTSGLFDFQADGTCCADKAKCCGGTTAGSFSCCGDKEGCVNGQCVEVPEGTTDPPTEAATTGSKARLWFWLLMQSFFGGRGGGFF
jgi:hypothetical protein